MIVFAADDQLSLAIDSCRLTALGQCIGPLWLAVTSPIFFSDRRGSTEWSDVFACATDKGVALDVCPEFPALASPVGDARCIVAEYVDVEFSDALAFKSGKAAFDQCIGDAFPSVLALHGQMLQIAPAAIVAGHDAADKLASGQGDKTETGVSLQVLRGVFP